MKSIEDIDLRDKRVFIRVDFNVPLREGRITDATRIDAPLRTVRWALDHGAKVVLASHLGRPTGKPDPKLSLEPVAAALNNRLGGGAPLVPDCVGLEVEGMVAALAAGSYLLLENLRFHPGEEANDEGFSRQLARLADVYVNDAFGTAHRAHASTAGMARFLEEKAAGFLLHKECEYLSKVMRDSVRPLVAILGGAKVSDKIAVIESLLDKVDVLLIGGAMAYTFLSATGTEVGDSLVEADYVPVAKKLLDKGSRKGARVLLPIDHRVSRSLKGDKPSSLVSGPIPSQLLGVDIGPATEALFAAEVSKGGTVFWNGPMGIFEVEAFSHGTMAMVEALVASSALTIVGGGDSVAAAIQSGKADRISHLSTGGGASLEFVEGRQLPGLAALET